MRVWERAYKNFTWVVRVFGFSGTIVVVVIIFVSFLVIFWCLVVASSAAVDVVESSCYCYLFACLLSFIIKALSPGADKFIL